MLTGKNSIYLEMFQGYFTGILTHLILISPWYFTISHFKFSIILLPFACVANLLVSKKVIKNLNSWYYRDHWLGHNSEFDFIYLHGSHHDALPQV